MIFCMASMQSEEEKEINEKQFRTESSREKEDIETNPMMWRNHDYNHRN